MQIVVVKNLPAEEPHAIKIKEHQALSNVASALSAILSCICRRNRTILQERSYLGTFHE